MLSGDSSSGTHNHAEKDESLGDFEGSPGGFWKSSSCRLAGVLHCYSSKT